MSNQPTIFHFIYFIVRKTLRFGCICSNYITKKESFLNAAVLVTFHNNWWVWSVVDDPLWVSERVSNVHTCCSIHHRDANFLQVLAFCISLYYCRFYNCETFPCSPLSCFLTEISYLPYGSHQTISPICLQVESYFLAMGTKKKLI